MAAKPAEAAQTEVNVAEIKPPEIKAATIKAAEVEVAEVHVAEITPAEVKATEANVAEIEATEVDAAAPEPTDLTATDPKTRQPQRTDAWAKLIADPAHAPELLALAAVQTIGPRAKTWATQTRTHYPTADNQALARLATRQFTRFGSLTSLFGAIAGSYAPAALLAGAALTHAELVLHLAAAYGLDPTDPERAADLLVVTRVHATREEAEAAITSARRPPYDESGGVTDAIYRLGRMLAAQSGGWAAVRIANRYFPGASLLTAILAGTASAHGAAARATAYYRSQVSSESGSSV